MAWDKLAEARNNQTCRNNAYRRSVAQLAALGCDDANGGLGRSMCPGPAARRDGARHRVVLEDYTATPSADQRARKRWYTTDRPSLRLGYLGQIGSDLVHDPINPDTSGHLHAWLQQRLASIQSAPVYRSDRGAVLLPHTPDNIFTDDDTTAVLAAVLRMEAVADVVLAVVLVCPPPVSHLYDDKPWVLHNYHAVLYAVTSAHVEERDVTRALVELGSRVEYRAFEYRPWKDDPTEDADAHGLRRVVHAIGRAYLNDVWLVGDATRVDTNHYHYVEFGLPEHMLAAHNWHVNYPPEPER
jgi:hypothetical protein